MEEHDSHGGIGRAETTATFGQSSERRRQRLINALRSSLLRSCAGVTRECAERAETSIVPHGVGGLPPSILGTAQRPLLLRASGSMWGPEWSKGGQLADARDSGMCSRQQAKRVWKRRWSAGGEEGIRDDSMAIHNCIVMWIGGT